MDRGDPIARRNGENMTLRTFKVGAPVLGSLLLLSGWQAAQAADAAASGVPERTTLIDNNKVHITLYTFKTGYERAQPVSRQADQMIVYLDDGAVQPLGQDRSASGGDCSKASSDCGPIAPNGKPEAGNAITRGSVAWHPKGSQAPAVRVTKGYRALVIDLKHGTMTGPDPAAADLPREPKVGGGAPVKVLIDNDMIRANMVSFPSGFIRAGGYRRRLDTIIAYVDDAELKDVGPSQQKYDVVQQLSAHPDAIAECPPIKDCDSVAPDGKWAKGPTVRGTVAWHQQDGYVERIQIGKNYRALYIELK